jgi:hypothetical protein
MYLAHNQVDMQTG